MTYLLIKTRARANKSVMKAKSRGCCSAQLLGEAPGRLGRAHHQGACGSELPNKYVITYLFGSCPSLSAGFDGPRGSRRKEQRSITSAESRGAGSLTFKPP
jgi:hypothetical protein